MKLALRFRNGKPDINWLAVQTQLKERYKIGSLEDKIFELNIKPLRAEKTMSQLGYFHAEIVQKWRLGLMQAGYQVPPGKSGDEYVKYQIKTLPEINFREKKENIITGKKESVIRSLESASIEEMTHIIDVAIKVAQEYLGISIETPEDHKKRRGGYDV